MSDASATSVFTPERLLRLRDNLKSVQETTVQFSEAWNRMREELPSNLAVTHLFSNAIYWQFKAVDRLYEAGFASCSPPLLRSILENTLRMIYLERKASNQEREAFLNGIHVSKLKSFNDLLQCDGKTKEVMGAVADQLTEPQARFCLDAWKLLSGYVHVNFEKFGDELAGDCERGAYFPLRWIEWELHLAARSEIDQVFAEVNCLTLYLRFLLIYAQLLYLVVTGHYAVIYEDIQNSSIAKMVIESFEELLRLHRENSDLYTGGESAI